MFSPQVTFVFVFLQLFASLVRVHLNLFSSTSVLSPTACHMPLIVFSLCKPYSAIRDRQTRLRREWGTGRDKQISDREKMCSCGEDAR